MNCVFPILLFLVYSKLDGVKGALKNYDEILQSLRFPEKLVFDVTKPLNEKLVNGVSPDSVNLADLGTRSSPILYYRRGREYYNTTNYTETDKWPAEKYIFSVMFGNTLENQQPLNLTLPIASLSTEALLELAEANPTKYFTIIFTSRHIWPINEGFNDFIRDFQSRNQQSNIKFGLQYDIDDNTSIPLDAKPYQVFFLPFMVDVAIANIGINIDNIYDDDISSLGFIYSYSKFRAKLHQIPTFRFNNQKPPQYIKFTFRSPRYGTELFQKYYFYLLQFSVFWLNKRDNVNGQSFGIILDSFDNKVAHQNGLDGAELKEILSIPIGVTFYNTMKSCKMKAISEQISVNYKSGILNGRYSKIDKCILANDVGCPKHKMEREVCNRPNTHFPLLHIYLAYNRDDYSYDSDAKNYIIQMRNTSGPLAGLPWKQLGMNKSHEETIGSASSEIVDFRLKLSIACNVNLVPIKKEIMGNPYVLEQACGEYLWDDSSVIILMIDNVANLERKMIDLLKSFPDKSFVIDTGRQTDPSFPTTRDNLFCQSVLLRRYEETEQLIHFARIHNINVTAPYVFDYDDWAYIGWSAVQTIDELNVTKTQFPVLVARNHPDNFLLGEVHTDPCIPWTMEVPLNGIEIDPRYGGTSLYMTGMKNGSISSTELQLMLQFALQKFSLLEIIADTIGDLETIFGIMSRGKTVDRFGLDKSSPPKLFLRVDIAILKHADNELGRLLGKLDKVTLQSTRIYLTNWKNFNGSTHFQKLRETGLRFGVELEDCVKDVNNYFEDLKKFQHLEQTDFILCNIKYPERAKISSNETVAKYLDTTLYIQKYFQRIFNYEGDNKDILFRLNTVSEKIDTSTQAQLKDEKLIEQSLGEEASNFLNFFNHVSKYAILYKIKLFMFPAFDDITGGRFGWWAISDFQSLSNASSFTEKEKELFGRETWRPVQEMELKVETIDMVKYIGFGISTVFFFITVALVLRSWYRSQFYTILTKEEADEFRNGKSEVLEGEETTFNNMKYPKEYEIPRHRFELLNIIGKGAFGLVYKATLSYEESDDTCDVAVKIPNSDCTKVSFRSMLSELKILCYIGRHPHVIDFVGAYIKEIGKGIVHIATEFCENGALQEHLRKISTESHQIANAANGPSQLQSDAVEGSSPQNESPHLYDLRRFSHEIAKGMEYIANKRVVHGDLSTRNVLLDSYCRCKIADFGLSRKLYEYEEYIKKNSEPLPWRWLSIESLERMEYTTKSDVWSYGITLWEIFSLGRVPYPGLSWTIGFVEELKDGLRNPAPEFSSDEIYGTMLTCWNIDPAMRPSFTELSQFFASIQEQEYIQMDA